MSALARYLAPTCLIGFSLLAPGGPRRSPSSSYHVSPTGKAGGDGTARRPWDLATALAGARAKIKAGDTVWLHGGRYRGSFRTALTGAPDRPIVFRQAAGERATIDGTLVADGSYLTFWGFEITQSTKKTYGLEARTNMGRFINLVIHDAGTMGVSFWTPGENAELYGCIVYRNGTHDNLDHGVYVHNVQGKKVLADNVFFENLAYGIHVYAGARNAPQRNVRLEGNISFNNGTISRRYRAKGNILVGGEVPMSGIEVLENLLYFGGRDGENMRLGYSPIANGDLVARDNFIWGGQTALRLSGTWALAAIGGNTLGGARQLVQGDLSAGRRNTLYDGSRTPTTPTVIVRPNRYEPGRAHIAIYNFTGQPTVKVDVSRVLTRGNAYEVRNVQDVFGAPVAHGIYAGDSLVLPARTFDAFLLTLSASASAPSGKSRSRAE